MNQPHWEHTGGAGTAQQCSMGVPTKWWMQMSAWIQPSTRACLQGMLAVHHGQGGGSTAVASATWSTALGPRLAGRCSSSGGGGGWHPQLMQGDCVLALVGQHMRGRSGGVAAAFGSFCGAADVAAAGAPLALRAWQRLRVAPGAGMRSGTSAALHLGVLDSPCWPGTGRTSLQLWLLPLQRSSDTACGASARGGGGGVDSTWLCGAGAARRVAPGAHVA